MLPHLGPYWKDDFVFQDSSSLMTMLLFGYQKTQIYRPVTQTLKQVPDSQTDSRYMTSLKVTKKAKVIDFSSNRKSIMTSY